MNLVIDALIRSILFNFKDELKGMGSVLVLGCGPYESITYLKQIKSVAVDIVFNDLLYSRQNKVYNNYVCCDVRNLCFKPKSYDLVIASHLIEHLKKRDGWNLLSDIEEIARKKIILGVPNDDKFFGEYEWCGSMHVGHQSHWKENEFKNIGYQVRGVDGLKIIPQRICIGVKYRNKKWVRRLIQSSEMITRYFPSTAYNFICIKKMQ